ncbi:hypothetical protein [Kineococcus sp. SYSU DK004]|uniref:hypothetical protein n=1 Tax=Kineococcus sp. SYSU DK004 TaxID=3383125 RepID=UPI003D7DEC86
MAFDDADTALPAESARTARLVEDLRAVWGDELPPGRDPVATVVTDAVVFDDANGRARGVVVQGDQLGLDVLAVLLESDGSRTDRLALLPAALRERLFGRRGAA